ncbi:hypothetical protein HUN01_02410 (plasmid) [Nostoc edaphicum CCNP1411]|uniref:Uncharacterized protein n=1 Tax=Nostoc edaphicum CCNP1411 TaxID=1472755 RepID=A0A7D7L9Z9_9NOSO|nr:hypothetical protein [Nostoc edaphicum]QMS86474.1 hypothetical protein HUN01_02410 [Nostoc edaphicum CCNP1411]
MIDDGEAKEIKRDYLDILESLLKLIHAKAKEKGLDPSKDVSIYSSSSKVYQGTLGESPSKNLLTPTIVENLKKALSDPKNSQGAISIKIGNEKVFHIKNGEVLTDKLGLAPPSPKNKVVSNERIYSVEALQKQVAVLQSKLESQQKLVDSLKKNEQTSESLSELAAQVSEMGKSLEKQQQLIENTQKALSQVNERFLPQVQNTKLQNWVGSVERQVKKTAKNVFEQIKDALTPEVTKLRKEIAQMKAHIEQQVTNRLDEVRENTDNVRDEFNQQIGNLTQELRTQVDGVKNTVDQSLMGVKSAIDNTRTELRDAVKDVKGKVVEESVKALLNILGTNNPDGSKSFKSTTFDFERLGENVIVRAKNGEPVLTDGVLSPNVSDQQLQALDKVQSVVNMHHQIQQDSQQESQFRNMHR